MSAIAFKQVDNGVWRVIVADQEAWDALPNGTPLQAVTRKSTLKLLIKAGGGVHFHSDEIGFHLVPGTVYECFPISMPTNGTPKQ